ncbi:MAG: FAD-dependent monooxygenase [Betaproteobacteria bacterium]|nr:FAD-dependent monooxygenase [Betaproteobacteria bacterium]
MLPIAIVGGGPAGMALALALRHHGVAAQILDARPRGAARADKRILALSHGSHQILEWLGVWKKIAATPITAIHVSQPGSFGRTRLNAREQGVPALGYVAAAASVSAALDDALTAARISLHDNCRVSHATPSSGSVCLHTATGETQTPLVIYAEGAVDNNDAATVTRDYGQQAVLCTTTLPPATPHCNLAYERFTPRGPLALLPFGQQLAVVYICPAQDAAALAALPDAAFLSNLQAHFGDRLEFTAVSPRHLYPLALRYRKSPIGPRAVWLGNAAQTLHPVAGQGFNLALRDTWELARTLAHANDPGDAAVLARYARARRLDRRSMIGFTDILIRLFGSDDPLLRHARGLALLALDLLPPARSFVARRMLFGARAW